MQSLFSSLNTDQQAAVEDTHQLVLVQAGPGTGKTLTLVAKIGWLLAKKVPPNQIFAITFTHKAAEEIKERVQQMSSHLSPNQLNLGTFHSLALQLLQIDELTLLTEPEQRFIAQKIKADLQLKQPTQELLLLTSRVKNDLSLRDKLGPEPLQFFQKYDQELTNLHKLDFDDLLLKLLSALKSTNFAQNSYLLVDEFQDVSPVQYQIVADWTQQAKQVFLIGDPRQAIYGFRGASADSFTKLAQGFPGLSAHQLLNNYRSGAEILTVASRLFLQDKKLNAKVKHGGEVKFIKTFNQFTEADWVVNDIEQKLGGTGLISASEHHQQTGANLKDFVVIYRLHQLGTEVEKKLKQTGLPYQKSGSDSFYTGNEVQLVINMWRLAALADEDKNLWLEILNNRSLNISPASLQKIWQEQKENLVKFLQRLVVNNILPAKDCGQIRKVLDLQVELKNKLKQKENLLKLLEFTFQKLIIAEEQTDHWAQLRVELMQFTDQPHPLNSFLNYYLHLKKCDFLNLQADKISLLTMHSAKGLEFDWVYLLGFERDLVPFKKKKESLLPEMNSEEEERNLFFVTLTRAKKGLHLMFAENRWRKKSKSSRFLQEIASEPLQKIEDQCLSKIMKKQQKKELESRQTRLF